MCYGLNLKCPSQALVVECLVPSWWCYLVDSENLTNWDLAGGSRSWKLGPWEYLIPGLFLFPAYHKEPVPHILLSLCFSALSHTGPESMELSTMDRYL
jgi:hypothetical protein